MSLDSIMTVAVPSRAECFDLIRRYEMLPNIVRHSALVADIAVFLAQKLDGGGRPLNMALVEAGALLHDIRKTEAIATKENHALTGGELLLSLGYPAVADIVRQHVRLDPGVCDSAIVSEAEVVNYADKRVKHEEVVDIEERFRDIQQRYAAGRPHLQKRIEEVYREARALEKKIFRDIDVTTVEIIQMFSGK